eukprot:2783991-Pyramimonas_sp.AAC.1
MKFSVSPGGHDEDRPSNCLPCVKMVVSNISKWGPQAMRWSLPTQADVVVLAEHRSRGAGLKSM